MKYDDPVISKQRNGIGNKVFSNITINSGVCYRGSEICNRNATATCFKCSIMTGDTDLNIQFEPTLTIKTVDKLDQVITQALNKAEPEFKPEKLLKLPHPVNEPKKITITLPKNKEDNEDKSTFVNHTVNSISHLHTGHNIRHIHYPIYGVLSGTNCFICNYPIFGRQVCPECEQIFNEEY